MYGERNPYSSKGELLQFQVAELLFRGMNILFVIFLGGESRKKIDSLPSKGG